MIRPPCYLTGLMFAAVEVAQVMALLSVGYVPSASDHERYVWSSEDGRVKLNGNPVDIKGATWFGFQTATRAPHGLWNLSARHMNYYLDFMAGHEFNAIRVPLDLDLMLNDGTPRELVDEYHMTSLQLLDYLIKGCGDRGILVLLDLHSLDIQGSDQSPLWFNSNFSQEDAITGWTNMAKRYNSTWNVFAIDVFNEPTGATWGEGKDTDMDVFASKVANAVHAIAPEWLVFVQGTMRSPRCKGTFNSIVVKCGYGDNLKGVASHPLKLAKPEKLVYSPHAYGPSQHNKPEFHDPNFPSNMPAIWDDHWGYVKNQTGRAVVIGEWGGAMMGSNLFWYEAITAYLQEKNIRDNFIWCINSKSSTTGLLIAWDRPDAAKLDMLRKLQPKPTVFKSSRSREYALSQFTRVRLLRSGVNA